MKTDTREVENPKFVFVKDRVYEFDCQRFLGADGGFVGTLWELASVPGSKRIHCSTIEYGQSEEEVRDKLNDFIIKYLNHPY
jgi:hypothetical protein